MEKIFINKIGIKIILKPIETGKLLYLMLYIEKNFQYNYEKKLLHYFVFENYF